jgi:type IV secretion system protein VirB8
MNKRNQVPLESYYRDAESWATDQQDALRKSRSVAWKVAAAVGAIALLEAGALLLLIPLKTEVPYLMLVDRNTGYVQALDPLDNSRVTPDSALTQAFLAQYVVARESFDIDTLQTNYRKVGLWSAEKARAEYVAAMQASNPQSPLSRYPRSAVVETQVKSVSSLGANVAMVRFETRVLGADGTARPSLSAWVAVIRYRYSGEPMTIEDRLLNPLGFQVLRYRRSAEALPVQPVPSAAPAGAYQDPRLPAAASPAPFSTSSSSIPVRQLPPRAIAQ